MKQTTREHLDRFIRERMAAAGTPGMVVAVTDHQGLLHVAAHGLADVSSGRAVDGDTLFEIGSISKSFTAIALLQLLEEGLVDVDSPVQRYMPWFQVPPGPGLAGRAGQEHITLHHLLTHSAGIITGTDFCSDGRYEVWSLRHTEATTPPGTFYHYCNVGYKALGIILEEVSGLSYAEIIGDRILQPLGMGASEAVISHDTRRRLATGYEPLYQDRPYHRSLPLAPALWLETGTGDGSIASTPADMAAYVRLLLNRGQGPGGRLLAEESFRLLAGRLMPVTDGGPDSHEFYGFGLNVGLEDGHTIVSHSGSMVGYYGAVAADMEAGLGVVALCNGPGEPVAVARQVLRVLRAEQAGRDLALPPPDEPGIHANAGQYAGVYRCGDRQLELQAQGGRLVLQLEEQTAVLERRGVDCFYVAHPALSRFLLRFGRQAGQVAEAYCGPEVYVRQGCVTTDGSELPAAWQAYAGHYRCPNPWQSSFRVFTRRGQLLLALAWGEEKVLVPLGEGLFRVGDDPRLPERLRFDAIAGGQALHANLAGNDFYRTFTP